MDQQESLDRIDDESDRLVIIPKDPDDTVKLKTGISFNDGVRSPWEPRLSLAGGDGGFSQMFDRLENRTNINDFVGGALSHGELGQYFNDSQSVDNSKGDIG